MSGCSLGIVPGSLDRSGVHSRVVTRSARALAALELNGWGGVYTASTGEALVP